MMKNKTYHNVLRASKLICAKGYDEKTSYKIALQCFDNMERSNNGMPAEFFIDMIVDREQWEEESKQRVAEHPKANS